MRNLDGILDLRPTLIGSISMAGTAVGVPIDTMGFREVLATLTVGAANGTTTAQAVLDVKFQESDDPVAIGATWTDIENGDQSGTMAFSTVTLLGTDPSLFMGMVYERLGGNRKRYIRGHATHSGTNGIGPKYCVNLLLGRPNDTLYIQSGVTQATVNPEVLSNR